MSQRTQTVTFLTWRPPHMQFQIAERVRPGHGRARSRVCRWSGGPEQRWRSTTLPSVRHTPSAESMDQIDPRLDNRPLGLSVGSPPHSRRSAEGTRRSQFDPTATLRQSRISGTDQIQTVENSYWCSFFFTDKSVNFDSCQSPCRRLRCGFRRRTQARLDDTSIHENRGR